MVARRASSHLCPGLAHVALASRCGAPRSDGSAPLCQACALKVLHKTSKPSRFSSWQVDGLSPFKPATQWSATTILILDVYIYLMLHLYMWKYNLFKLWFDVRSRQSQIALGSLHTACRLLPSARSSDKERHVIWLVPQGKPPDSFLQLGPKPHCFSPDRHPIAKCRLLLPHCPRCIGTHPVCRRALESAEQGPVEGAIAV